MALSLRGIPALSFQPKGSVNDGRRRSGPSACTFSRKCKRIPCIYCSAQGSEDSPSDDSWASQNKGDSYAGWSFLDISNNKKKNMLPGFVKIGAGIAIAVGFALVSHAASKKVLLVTPTAAVYQETSPETTACDHASSSEKNVSEEIDGQVVEEKGLDVVAEGHAELEEGVDTTMQEQPAEATTVDATTTSTIGTTPSGQVSLSDDAVHEDDTPSAYATGVASTFGEDDGLVQNQDLIEDVTTEVTESNLEDSPNPSTDTTLEVTNTTEATPEITEGATITPEGTPEVTTEGVLDGTFDIPLVFSDQPVEVYASEVEAEAPLIESVKEIEVSLAVEVSKVGASPVGNADELLADDNLVSVATPVVSPSEFLHFTSVGIPAPSTPFAMISGRIVVPPVVDHSQEQALSALQSLKVVEPGVEAGHICTRREYARWLVTANRTLARNSAAKVLPAMYMEKATELAFSDVSPSDPDFPFIQGLAEAGLIASQLSNNDGETMEFSPDSSLSRQDLVSWKSALDHHNLQNVEYDRLLEKTGFIDLEHIHKDAWPSIVADVSAGDRSIIASAFGYTRRFQPQKPVTKGQAAIALVSGDSSELVVEELARLEAEGLAEKAVAAEIAIEARMQKESNEVFREELEIEKQMTAAAEELARNLKAELDSLKTEAENEKMAMMKEKASVEAAKESVSQTRVEMDEMMQGLSLEKIKVVFERERLEKLLAEIEVERETMAKLKGEMEVETKALTLARAWAEDEAKKARAHAKVLEEARKRWETQGIEVHVDKDLDDINIPVPSWQFNGEKFELEKSQEEAPVKRIMVKADEFKGRFVHFVREALQLSGLKTSALMHKVVFSLQVILAKAEEVRRNTFFVVTAKAGEVKKVSSSKAAELQKAAASMASGLTSLVSENTHKLADGCKGSAEKLAQIFKP